MAATNNNNFSFLERFQIFHLLGEALLFKKVVRCDDLVIALHFLGKPLEELRMHNLLSSIGKDHRFRSEVYYLLLLAHGKEEAIADGHLAFVTYSKSSFLNFGDNIPVLHQLDMHGLVHGVKHFTFLLVVAEQLVYVVQKIVAHQVQKMADY